MWAWNPGTFGDPAAVESVLKRMWANNLSSMDKTAWSMLGDDRREVKRMIAENETNIHHHTFDVDNALGARLAVDPEPRPIVGVDDAPPPVAERLVGGEPGDLLPALDRPKTKATTFIAPPACC